MIYRCVRIRDGDQYPSEIYDGWFEEKFAAEETCEILNKIDYRDRGKWIVISPNSRVVEIEKKQK